MAFAGLFVSRTHNMLYGALAESSRRANVDVAAPVSGYHESGVMLSQLLQKNYFGAAYLYFNAGVFYHRGAGIYLEKARGVYGGLSAGF